jgi:SHS family lactate transporter-like MFS transporter
LLQQGYAFGYLLVTAFARGLVDTTEHGWRPLFWFGACPPVLFIIFRLCLPETEAFRGRERVRKGITGGVGATFLTEGKVAIKRHWLLLVYLVLLMTGFNFLVSGSRNWGGQKKRKERER